jgi:hypothetical protein
VPNILLDHKFLAKLRAGGARKALLRLELLTKLHQMVATSRESAFKRLDIDARVASGLRKDGTLEVNPSDYISPLYSDEAHTLKRRKGGLLLCLQVVMASRLTLHTRGICITPVQSMMGSKAQ